MESWLYRPGGVSMAGRLARRAGGSSRRWRPRSESSAGSRSRSKWPAWWRSQRAAVNTAVALAWLLGIVLLPVLGMLCFWFFTGATGCARSHAHA